MTDLHIKPTGVQDVSRLVTLARQTFEEAFAHQNTKADLEKYLDEHFTPAKLSDELNDPTNKFFIAYADTQAAGYCKLRLNQHPDQPKNTKALELERIYVLREYQSKKVGAALMEHVINYSKANHYETLWLGVWEKNEKAIAFYKRWGFEIYGTHPFQLGNDPQTDVLMKKRLL